MLCNNCSNIRFQWFEDIAEAAAYAQNPVNIVFERVNQYVVSSVDNKFFIHQPSFEHLTQSKHNGCYICAALWFAFNEASKEPKQNAIDSITAGGNSSTAGNSQLASHLISCDANICPVVWRVFASRRAKYASDKWFDLKETVYVYCGGFHRLMYQVETPEGPYMRIAHQMDELWETKELLEIDNSTRSDGTFELAKLWYSNCVSNHPACAAVSDQSLTTTPMLPKRVIDVKTDGVNPVLYEPLNCEAGEYICLSHCWGKTKPMQIKRESNPNHVSGRKNSVVCELPSLAKWPKSFQDAVFVTRKFNVRFLWIDNACIKQEDRQDWVSESQKMAQYFSNATFTLAPSWAPDDDAGIFHARNPLLTYPLRLIPAFDKSSYAGYYISLAGLDRVYGQEILGAPLFTRAWVLQEQQLSRRLLRFGAKGIYWQCFCSRPSPASMTPKDFTPYQHHNFGNDQQLRMHIQPNLSDTPANEGRNPYLDLWYGTLVEFTSRNMKMKSDVLPAISGLAQAFAGYMDQEDRYVAGLWQSDLSLGLLWTVDVEGTRSHAVPVGTNYEPTGFSGPSWSWISHCHRRIRLHYRERMLPGGACNYLKNASLLGTEVIGADINYKPSGKPYGEVESGKLFFKAKLPSLRISGATHRLTSEDEQRRNMINDSLNQTHVHLLKMDKTPFAADSLINIEGVRERKLVGECDIDDPNSELWLSCIRNGIVEAMLLPLIMYRGDPEGLRVAGLVLLPTGDEDTFVRIGRAEVDMPNKWSLHESTLPMRDVIVA